MSRRSALRTAAGAGAGTIMAGGALMAAAPAVAADRPASRSQSPKRVRQAETGGRVDTNEQVVVHVRDAHSGEMDIFAGTSQTRLIDPDLAARLVRAAR
jgi:hypothetical protein